MRRDWASAWDRSGSVVGSSPLVGSSCPGSLPGSSGWPPGSSLEGSEGVSVAVFPSSLFPSPALSEGGASVSPSAAPSPGGVAPSVWSEASPSGSADWVLSSAVAVLSSRSPGREKRAAKPSDRPLLPPGRARWVKPKTIRTTAAAAQAAQGSRRFFFLEGAVPVWGTRDQSRPSRFSWRARGTSWVRAAVWAWRVSSSWASCRHWGHWARWASSRAVSSGVSAPSSRALRRISYSSQFIPDPLLSPLFP